MGIVLGCTVGVIMEIIFLSEHKKYNQNEKIKRLDSRVRKLESIIERIEKENN